MDGLPATPGYLEIDAVAHCGHRNEGDYLVTINAKDRYLGWDVTRTVRNKALVHMKAGRDHNPAPTRSPWRASTSTTAASS
jgi:hypothetical protein